MDIHRDTVTAAKVLNMLLTPVMSLWSFVVSIFFYLSLRMLNMSSILLAYYKLHSAVTYRCYAYSRWLDSLYPWKTPSAFDPAPQ